MTKLAASKFLVCLMMCALAGCASKNDHPPADESMDMSATDGKQPDLIPVIAALHDQMHSWEGTRYQWGGTQLTGVDCSGFVWRTLKDRFNIPMDRVTTRELIAMGRPVDKTHLQPGDLVFFRIKHELHVGFYDTDQQFLHASVSQGVMRSSLNNPYWKSVYLEARRLPREQNSQISFNYKNKV
ncbi:NlpC/P60 family protein [Pantoea eucrina]|uniref:NlpC/P60 family protein n=1 Tax=Pantoea eucrina TaxID=472693 RepID=A0ABU5LKH9_9GAMM|nr:NlpC/P60 family protein [Pantoea eucrina]MDZ7280210.1 NlpC/P60 family protein [Pantoea eucrina]